MGGIKEFVECPSTYNARWFLLSDRVYRQREGAGKTRRRAKRTQELNSLDSSLNVQRKERRDGAGLENPLARCSELEIKPETKWRH
jgi:hypothetical protein